MASGYRNTCWTTPRWTPSTKVPWNGSLPRRTSTPSSLSSANGPAPMPMPPALCSCAPLWKRPSPMPASGGKSSKAAPVRRRQMGPQIPARAGDIYHHILDKYADKLVRLGDIAAVRFGIKTGANDFFYLTPERIAEWGIEDDFLQPIVIAPRQITSLTISPERLASRVFMYWQDKAELAGTNALKYIASRTCPGRPVRRRRTPSPNRNEYLLPTNRPPRAYPGKRTAQTGSCSRRPDTKDG